MFWNATSTCRLRGLESPRVMEPISRIPVLAERKHDREAPCPSSRCPPPCIRLPRPSWLRREGVTRSSQTLVTTRPREDHTVPTVIGISSLPCLLRSCANARNSSRRSSSMCLAMENLERDSSEENSKNMVSLLPLSFSVNLTKFACSLLHLNSRCTPNECT